MITTKMLKDVIEIKSGITINVGLSANIRKNIMYEKNIILQSILNVLVKTVNNKKVLLVIQ